MSDLIEKLLWFTDASREMYRYVHVESLRAWATDGHRATVLFHREKMPEVPEGHYFENK